MLWSWANVMAIINGVNFFLSSGLLTILTEVCCKDFKNFWEFFYGHVRAEMVPTFIIKLPDVMDIYYDKST